MNLCYRGVRSTSCCMTSSTHLMNHTALCYYHRTCLFITGTCAPVIVHVHQSWYVCTSDAGQVVIMFEFVTVYLLLMSFFFHWSLLYKLLWHFSTVVICIGQFWSAIAKVLTLTLTLFLTLTLGYSGPSRYSSWSWASMVLVYEPKMNIVRCP